MKYPILNLLSLYLVLVATPQVRLMGQDSKRPNFVIIMADDLGFGDLSCFDGWIKTPHLNQLAASGLRLTDYHSNGAVCSPTRAALLTGRYQQRVGIPRVIVANPKAAEHRNGLPEKETTFAEALQRQGYATAIFGKWHLGYFPQFNPSLHGFQEFRGYLSGNVDFFSHVDQAGNADWWHNQKRVEEPGYVTHLITAHAVRFLEEHQEGPFCLYLPHEAPHYPYQGPHDKADRSPGGSFANHGSRVDKKQAYREMVEELDKGVGQIVAKLQELGLDQNTIIFFCSDNGATRLGSNAPYRGHKGSVWEGGHRVPAIAYWPGQIQPGESNQTMLSMDLMPTLLALADTQAGVWSFDGRDVSKHWLAAAKLPERTLFWDTTKSQAVRDGAWKLVKENNSKVPQLFHLTVDPKESQDVSKQHPQIRDQLLTQLKKWEKDVQSARSRPLPPRD